MSLYPASENRHLCLTDSGQNLGSRNKRTGVRYLQAASSYFIYRVYSTDRQALTFPVIRIPQESNARNRKQGSWYGEYRNSSHERTFLNSFYQMAVPCRQRRLRLAQSRMRQQSQNFSCAGRRSNSCVHRQGSCCTSWRYTRPAASADIALPDFTSSLSPSATILPLAIVCAT